MLASMQNRWPELAVSLLVGFVVFALVWGFLTFWLDFWHLGAVLGPALGIGLGGYAAFKMFTRDMVVPPSVKDWVVPTLVIIAIVIGLGRIATIARSDTNDQSQKQQQSQAKTKGKYSLSLPAYGYSNHVVPEVGYATTFYGHGFTIHCVYRDRKEEGIVGDKKHPCDDGDMLYQYVRDVTGKQNDSVSYDFVRPGRR